MKVTLVTPKPDNVYYLTEFIPGARVASSPLDSQDVLIYWDDGEQGEAYYAFNSPDARRLLANSEEVYRILELNRVLTPNNIKGPVIRLRERYRVDIFDLKVIRVLVKRGPNDVPQVIHDPEEKTAKKICSIALTALYVLGLDFGSVTLGVDADMKKVVLGVNPGPRLSARLGRYFGQQIARNLEQLQREMDYCNSGGTIPFAPGLMFGADPEFMLYHRKRRQWLIASDYLPKHGTVGTDARAIYRPKHGYPLAELRPQPASNPLQLTEHIRAAIEFGKQYMPDSNIAWIAGSCPMKGFPIGGHIHFAGIQPTSRLVRALDNYLALPLLMLENAYSAAQRRLRYGLLGDIRPKSHGGFEYRTPASWLVSESITRAVLCLAALVAHDYPFLRRNVLNTSEAQENFYRCNKAYFRATVLSIWEDITRTPLYRRYQDHLELIGDMLERGEEWQERVDIKRTWRLGY